MAFRTNKTPVLQEKSASGAVASFNTALAMPLPSCNIAVNAWQEGSGDPSPDNVRPIHGWTECNAYQRGINLWDEQWEIGAYWNDTGLPRDLTDRIRCKTSIPVKGGISIYIPRYMAFFFFDKVGNAIDVGAVIGYTHVGVMYIRQSSEQTGLFLIPQNAVSMKFYMQDAYGTTYNNDISINYPSTDTDYHAYTGNTYTIQLGQEVYGAEVDVVNGVAHCTHAFVELDGSSDEGWSYREASNGFMCLISDMKPGAYMTNGLANWLPIVTRLDTFGVVLSVANRRIYCNQITNNISGVTDVDTWHTYLSTHHLQVVYPLDTPFDIQLTPQQIETLIGNNTIFADTGDIDLTYKDLDIAKRGNFREVFKLPS